MSEEDFMIFRISEEFRASSGATFDEERFVWLTLCRFLSESGLTLKPLPAKAEELTDGVEVRSSSLTSEGIAVLRAALSRWLRRVDQGKDPQNVDVLQSALQKIRGGQ